MTIRYRVAVYAEITRGEVVRVTVDDEAIRLDTEPRVLDAARALLAAFDAGDAEGEPLADEELAALAGLRVAIEEATGEPIGDDALLDLTAEPTGERAELDAARVALDVAERESWPAWSFGG